MRLIAASLPLPRQPGETEKAYRAFLSYRDLGPGRSLPRAEQGLRNGRARKPGASGNITARSARWDWVDRCRAWDNHLQARRDRAAAAEAEKWEARRLAVREAHFELAMELRRRVEKLLEYPILRRRGKTQAGEPITIEPAAWSQRDLAILAKAAAELAALAMPEPASVSTHSDHIPCGIQVPDVDDRWPLEEGNGVPRGH